MTEKRKRSERAPAPEVVDVNTRVLPHDAAAEKALLGAVLINSKMLLLASRVVKGADFFRRAHRMIFDAMVALDARNSEIDLITVLAELAKAGAQDEVGGPAYVSALTDGVPHSTNVEHYAAIVKGHAQRRALITAANQILADAYDAALEPHEVVTAADQAVIELQRSDACEFVSIAETVSDEYRSLETAAENRGKLIGITSGLPSLDDLTQGWQSGDFIVVAARPSIGKTMLTLNMAVAASDAGKHVAIFSLEMRRRQLQKRLLAHLSGVPMNMILSGHLGENDYARLGESMSRYAALRISINDRAHQTVWDIRTACRILKSQHRLDLVVVDYLQLMTGSLDARENRNAQLSDISRRLKVMADEIAAPVILLSQLNRAGDTRSDKRPILSDLRDTGALEQDADTVCFLHRKHHREDGLTLLILEKQRNGPGGTVNLSIRRDTQTFVDAGLEPEQPPLAEAPEPLPAPKPYRGPRRWQG